MNTERKIARAVERLTSLCMQISQGGQYHAFLNFSGHINGVEVYVHDSKRNYQAPQGEPLILRSVYLDPTFGAKEDALAQLEAIQHDLLPYLIQEAAA